MTTETNQKNTTNEAKANESAKAVATLQESQEASRNTFLNYAESVMGEKALSDKDLLKLIQSAKKQGESYKLLLKRASVHAIVFAAANSNNFTMLTELYKVLSTNEKDALVIWAKEVAPVRLAKLEDGEKSFRLDKSENAKTYDIAKAIATPFYEMNTAKDAVEKMIKYMSASSIKESLEKIIEAIDKANGGKSKTMEIKEEDKQSVLLLRASLRDIVMGMAEPSNPASQEQPAEKVAA